MSSMFLVAIVALVLLAPTTGSEGELQDEAHLPTSEVPAQSTLRIVGGIRTTIDKFPYQLSLQKHYMLNLMTLHICGAAIISKDWAITAAHCVYGLPSQILQVRAGTSYYFVGGELRPLSRIVVHEKYNKEGVEHDIALLKVKGPFIFTKSIQPIPLETGQIQPGTMAYVTGWGSVREGGIEPSQLMQVQIPIITTENCVSVYGKDITSGNICAGFKVGGKDSCQGDSGGPMAINGKLVGIVSWGLGCARPNTPGVYTKVSEYRYWIRIHTGV